VKYILHYEINCQGEIMRPQINGLDHLMLASANLTEAKNTFQRLGFTVTPYRTNEPMGGGKTGGRGGNHLVMMTPTNDRMANYLELAYADPDHAAPFMKDILGKGRGLAMLVHSGENLQQLNEAWQSEGLPPCSLYELNTDFTDPETGVTDKIHFEVLVPTENQGPFAVNACQYLEREHYLRKDWLEHPNGARHWSCVQTVVDDLSSCETFLKQVYGAEPSRSGETLVIEHGAQRLELFSKSKWKETYTEQLTKLDTHRSADTAVTIACEDLSRLPKLLDESGVQWLNNSSRILVPACDAGGVVMAFEGSNK
jgi:hypothetical protein